MKNHLVIFSIVACAVILSISRVQLYWVTQPWAGDFPFYVQCCTVIPNGEQLPVPIILYSLNLLVNNPLMVTFFVSALGYTLICLLVYLTTLQLTGNMMASAMAFFCFVAMIPNFLTPTAIKNLYGVVFMLLSIMIFDKYLKHRDAKLLVPLSLSVLLTATTHSVPIFPLTIIMMVNVLVSFRNNRVLLLISSVGSMLGILTLEFVGKIGKLFDIMRIFVSAPLEVLGLNISKCLSFSPPYLLHLSMVLFVAGSTISFLTMRQFSVIFIGLFLATLLLLFIGDIEYGERLIENAAPLVALIVGCCINFVAHKNDKMTVILK